MAQTRLFEKYKSEVIKGLMDKFGYKNIMEVPISYFSISSSSVETLMSTFS